SRAVGAVGELPGGAAGNAGAAKGPCRGREVCGGVSRAAGTVEARGVARAVPRRGAGVALRGDGDRGRQAAGGPAQEGGPGARGPGDDAPASSSGPGAAQRRTDPRCRGLAAPEVARRLQETPPRTERKMKGGLGANHGTRQTVPRRAPTVVSEGGFSLSVAPSDSSPLRFSQRLRIRVGARVTTSVFPASAL